MDQAPRLALIVIWLATAVSWLFSARYFLIVQAEYHRALKQGYNLPKAGLGLLFVIFMDLLPAVSKERRRLVWSLGVFFGLGLISALMLEIFGSH
jgi:hypothetical protein